MRAMRERQLRHLVTPGTVNAKYSQGGLVDLEYIVQGLQITHGAADPSLRVTNTARRLPGWPRPASSQPKTACAWVTPCFSCTS